MYEAQHQQPLKRNEFAVRLAFQVTPGGKIFASGYALYAGLVFIVTAALLFTPILHRLMHRFHWSEKL